jgi:deoxyribose-phosphate aldolase
MNIEPQDAARIALACLDLTSLNDSDTEADIARLCARAVGPFGTVAAVCVWPRLAAFARGLVPAPVGVAAVANFPDGGTDVARAVRDAQAIVDAGAQDVDVVLPWRALAAGDDRVCSELLAAVRRASVGRVLKVILESGELNEERLIRRASQLALAAGADFLKTSTGKTPTGATLGAARVMLQAIADDPAARTRVGFKASGGIRTVADVMPYLDLVAQILGRDALVPARLRIGASSLLGDIEGMLGGRAPSVPASGY